MRFAGIRKTRPRSITIFALKKTGATRSKRRQEFRIHAGIREQYIRQSFSVAITIVYIKEVSYIQSCCCGQNLSVFSGIICRSEQMCKIGNVHATV